MSIYAVYIPAGDRRHISASQLRGLSFRWKFSPSEGKVRWAEWCFQRVSGRQLPAKEERTRMRRMTAFPSIPPPAARPEPRPPLETATRRSGSAGAPCCSPAVSQLWWEIESNYMYLQICNSTIVCWESKKKTIVATHPTRIKVVNLKYRVIQKVVISLHYHGYLNSCSFLRSLYSIRSCTVALTEISLELKAGSSF